MRPKIIWDSLRLKVLQDAGSISAEFAKEKANREYELYDIKRKEADREMMICLIWQSV